ncbi:MAG: putative oxidoreductase [Pseudonocardiales bacterium]|nr:putative oxidoreductase [Pseudonocardiales bacterium]MDT7679588.1 putative oxidoreductase [Pseudonocardiales bacterium]
MSETESLVTTEVARPGKAWHVTLWVLQVLVAAMFLLAGYLKLASSPDMVALFAGIGIGQWFRYLTGTLEILGALALFIPRLRALGALGLAGVMIGALITDLFIVHISPLSALINLVVVVVIAWGRRRELATLLPTN